METVTMYDREFTQDEIDAVRALARLTSDSWTIGEVAHNIKSVQGLTDREISECLWEHHHKELDRPAIQASRATFEVFPNPADRLGFRFSHCHAARLAARKALGHAYERDLDEEEIRAERGWCHAVLRELPADASVERVEAKAHAVVAALKIVEPGEGERPMFLTPPDVDAEKEAEQTEAPARQTKILQQTAPPLGPTGSNAPLVREFNASEDQGGGSAFPDAPALGLTERAVELREDLRVAGGQEQREVLSVLVEIFKDHTQDPDVVDQLAAKLLDAVTR